MPHHTNYPRRPLYEILRRSAAEGHELTALSFLGADMTFGTLKNHADRLATALALRGIVKGDRVGVMLPNCPQYVIGVFAVLRLGATSSTSIPPTRRQRSSTSCATPGSGC